MKPLITLIICLASFKSNGQELRAQTKFQFDTLPRVIIVADTCCPYLNKGLRSQPVHMVDGFVTRDRDWKPVYLDPYKQPIKFPFRVLFTIEKP